MIKLTEEQKREILDSYIRGIGLEPKTLTKEDTEKEIVKFLSMNNVCVLATVSPDGKPRSTVVDYEHEGLTLYVMTEGGGKVENILKNPNVSLGIYAPHKTMRGVLGINYQGTAEVFTLENNREAMMKAVGLFKDVIENFKKEVKGVTPHPEIMKVIKISPVKIAYNCYSKGIAEAVWTK